MRKNPLFQILHLAGKFNEVIRQAAREFIAFMDYDDVQVPNALYEMAKKLN